MAATLDEITRRAEEDIAKADTPATLNSVASRYLGKKGLLTAERRNIGLLKPAQRPAAGARINQAWQQLQTTLDARKETLKAAAFERALNADLTDVTLPGRRQSAGSLHPITQTLRRIESIFVAAGYQVQTGPEIEDEYHNFTALNTPEHHPARAVHDTFYIQQEQDSTQPLLLRTHTSSVQVRTMEEHRPPLRIICPGKVYRADDPDATHTPMFHQVEGLVVDEGISMAHLKGTLLSFLKAFFGRPLQARFRPSYFPFTEPSAEVDMECVHCDAKGCRVCSQTGWVEVLGCGMVHPNVLEKSGVNPDIYDGFAFGFGVDRLCSLNHGIADSRYFFDNDLRFLQQFS